LKRILPPLLCSLLLASPGTSRTLKENRGDIRLVLQIVVDQLRGDLPYRYLDHFGQGGFRYLMEKGTCYDNAHYQHANTETIVGHAVLATGAFPSDSGMVANLWLDKAAKQLTYNIEDPRYETLDTFGTSKKAPELDPTQRLARSSGRSPAAILASTYSDELAVSTNEGAKIFGVSVKDRGAISLAGHTGKGFWFSKKTGSFVTSTFSYKQVPAWVNAWNRQKKAAAYAKKPWKLLDSPNTYLFGKNDLRHQEADLPSFGRTFPHNFGDPSDKLFYTLITLSPAGDNLTLDFTKKLIEEENIGQDDVPDYLGVSFSSNDYVGHFFGPSSLESEDNLRRLDRSLADLFAFVDKKVGLDRTLIVLSADHGAPEAPETLDAMGLEAGEMLEPQVLTDAVRAALNKRYGRDDLIRLYYHPYIYLDGDKLQEAGIDRAEAQRVLANAIRKLPGIADAVPLTDLVEGRLAMTDLYHKVLRNYHPLRSGDIHLIPLPYWFLYPENTSGVAVNHGSPWTYDTHVPIFWAGPGIPAHKRISRLVHPVDIAATLAIRTGTKFPSACAGVPLVEVLGRR
jgi:predicted AlkP superfamily pyrophosphatase or phosphodiesterase